MKTKLTFAALAIAASFAPMGAVHAEGMYAGLNYGQLKVNGSGLNVSPSIVYVNIGNEFSKNFAVEGRLGAGVGDETVRYSGVDVKVKVTSQYGLYAKGILPLAETFSVYGLLGYANTKVTASAGVGSATATAGHSGYGVGATLNATKNVSISAEWNHIDSGSTLVSIGAAYKF